MNFAFNEEQQTLRDMARRFLQHHSTPLDVRRVMQTERGWESPVYKRIAEELGWTALIVPEAYDGFDLTYVELVAILEEAGKSLLCAPLLSTVALATNALLLADNESVKAHWLPQIAAGSATAAVAAGRWSPGTIDISARSEGDGWRLNGTARLVVDGHTADALIVASAVEGAPGLSWFAVPAPADGLKRRCQPTMDQTRKLAEVTLEDVLVTSDQLLAHGDAGSALLARLHSLVLIALAAEQVGGAQACLDMAVEYGKVREQFGRAIGSFQAIKHKCADMLMMVESARSAAYYAGWTAAHAPDELDEAARVAASYCAEAYFKCAAENIQIHGGIGFTWEHEAHLYFKRARASEGLLGTPSQHRAALADTLLGSAG